MGAEPEFDLWEAILAEENDDTPVPDPLYEGRFLSDVKPDKRSLLTRTATPRAPVFATNNNETATVKIEPQEAPPPVSMIRAAPVRTRHVAPRQPVAAYAPAPCVHVKDEPVDEDVEMISGDALRLPEAVAGPQSAYAAASNVSTAVHNASSTPQQAQTASNSASAATQNAPSAQGSSSSSGTHQHNASAAQQNASAAPQNASTSADDSWNDDELYEDASADTDVLLITDDDRALNAELEQLTVKQEAYEGPPRVSDLPPLPIGERPTTESLLKLVQMRAEELRYEGVTQRRDVLLELQSVAVGVLMSSYKTPTIPLADLITTRIQAYARAKPGDHMMKVFQIQETLRSLAKEVHRIYGTSPETIRPGSAYQRRSNRPKPKPTFLSVPDTRKAVVINSKRAMMAAVRKKRNQQLGRVIVKREKPEWPPAPAPMPATPAPVPDEFGGPEDDNNDDGYWTMMGCVPGAGASKDTFTSASDEGRPRCTTPTKRPRMERNVDESGGGRLEYMSDEDASANHENEGGSSAESAAPPGPTAAPTAPKPKSRRQELREMLAGHVNVDVIAPERNVAGNTVARSERRFHVEDNQEEGPAPIENVEEHALPPEPQPSSSRKYGRTGKMQIIKLKRSRVGPAGERYVVVCRPPPDTLKGVVKRRDGHGARYRQTKRIEMDKFAQVHEYDFDYTARVPLRDNELGPDDDSFSNGHNWKLDVPVNRRFTKDVSFEPENSSGMSHTFYYLPCSDKGVRCRTRRQPDTSSTKKRAKAQVQVEVGKMVAHFRQMQFSGGTQFWLITDMLLKGLDKTVINRRSTFITRLEFPQLAIWITDALRALEKEARDITLTHVFLCQGFDLEFCYSGSEEKIQEMIPGEIERMIEWWKRKLVGREVVRLREESTADVSIPAKIELPRFVLFTIPEYGDWNVWRGVNKNYREWAYDYNQRYPALVDTVEILDWAKLCEDKWGTLPPDEWGKRGVNRTTFEQRVKLLIEHCNTEYGVLLQRNNVDLVPTPDQYNDQLPADDDQWDMAEEVEQYEEDVEQLQRLNLNEDVEMEESENLEEEEWQEEDYADGEEEKAPTYGRRRAKREY